jgi:elongation factor P
MAQVNEITRGCFVRYKGELMQVLEYEHRTPGNLRAFYQVKFRNVRNGRLAEERFRPSDEIEIVRVERREQQFLYRDGSLFYFMDMNTYEQTPVDEVVVGDAVKYLKDGMVVFVLYDGEEAVMVELPPNVDLEVTYTEPGIQGDTATRTLKPATLETGLEVRVPLFINIGDVVRIDTRTGEYVSRAK